MANREFYLKQAALLNKSGRYRHWWVFWAIYSTLLFYAYLAFSFLAGRLRLAFAMVIAFIAVRLVLCELIYFFVKKQRPFRKFCFKPAVPDSIPPVFLNIVDKRDDSMPSAHSSSMAAIAAAVFAFNPAWGAAFFGVALLTGAARVIVGYHYPADVLAGWLLGLLAGFASVHWVVPWLFTPRF